MEFHLGAIYCKCCRLAVIRSALQPGLGRFQMGATPQDSVRGPLAHTGFMIGAKSYMLMILDYLISSHSLAWLQVPTHHSTVVLIL